jgi:AcrR family transcriptional regulator
VRPSARLLGAPGLYPAGVQGLDLNGDYSQRQRDLIRVGAKLFAQRGYHAVGINDISGELGLTGPAFYRHFPSKEALLVALLDSAISEHLEQVREVVAATKGVEETLRAIIDHHLQFVFERTDHITTWRNEFRSLPEADRHRLRYLQRRYIEDWVHAVKLLRPELELEVVRALCQGAIALLQSPIMFQNTLGRAEMEPLLSSGAWALLMSATA